MILIGSRALALRAPKALNRQPLDFDFVGTEDEIQQFVDDRLPGTKLEELGNGHFVAKGESICEFEVVKPGSSSEALVELSKTDGFTSPFGTVPSLDLLFTLKTSHRYLKNSPHFWKNLQDWHRMSALGAKVRPEYAEFLKQREKETYTYKHPALNVKKADFFDDKHGVQYKYDHDSIHRAVAFESGVPAYSKYQKDGAEVECDRAKFFSLPEEIRQNGVIEESCVLAIERSLVPHPGAMTEKQAWLFAFSKVATSITSGWFREYSYESAPQILKRYPEGYYQRFLSGVNSGVVQLAT